jgi:hypothetical protein
MATSFEYPPAFLNPGPLQFGGKPIFPSIMKLRHHFFLCRLKVILQSILKQPCTVYLANGLRHETVSLSVFMCPHESHIWQTNVLTSQGFCTALGSPVPTPFFLQQLLNGPYIHDDIMTNGMHRGRFTSIVNSAEVSADEEAFCQGITGGFGQWWTSDDAEYPTFDELSALFTARMENVGE